ncbi:hypothetical protein [Halpernia humi]|nr:hypothetical protein [Halpernia humi]
MKKLIILKFKYFTPICFLIFFMPFLRMCHKPVKIADSTQIGDFDTKKQIGKQPKTVDIPTYQLDGLAKIEVNLNAYQLSGLTQLNEKDFQLKKYFDWNSLPMFFYLLIVINCALSVVFAFYNKFLLFLILSLLNLLLMIISTILFIRSGFIEEFSDFKYGFYFFVVYLILMIILAKKELEISKSNINHQL